MKMRVPSRLSHKIFGLYLLANLFVGFMAASAWASSGTEGASFLDIPVGAGPASLGSAYTALATNAYAPTWNPAGLGFNDANEMAAQHLSYLESIHYEYLSFSHPLGDAHGSNPTHRSIGVSAQYLASGDIPSTDISGTSIGSFNSHYGAYNVAYGQTVGDKLALGVTGKWINAKIDDVSANAYALDFGSLYKVTEKLSLAGTLTNVGTQLKFLSDGDPLPMTFHAGAAYEPTSHYLLTTEAVYARNGLGSFHIGGQWRPLEAISLRAGYRTDTLKGLSPLAGFSTGIGIHILGQELAYAWVPYGELGNTQYFSVLARFGAREEERRNLIHYQTIKKHRTAKGAETLSEPEYMQLMQLLSDDDSHVAQAGRSGSSYTK